MTDRGNGLLRPLNELTPGGTIRRRIWTSIAAVLVLLASGLSVPPAYAAGTSAAFSGGAGTATVGSVLYAKAAAALTLTVTTDGATCITGVPTDFTGERTSDTAKSTWVFKGPGDSGNGARAYTINASNDFNKNGNCTGPSATAQASYQADNTGPVITGALSPAPNAAGWNNSNVTITWAATDSGSGLAPGQALPPSTISANGISTVTSPEQLDRVGNVGTRSINVKIDKAAPTITAVERKNPNGTTTVTFTCSDSSSGGVESSGIATCLADGTSSNSRTVQPGTTVGGTATDKAGNTSTISVKVAAGDTTGPLLSGTPKTAPNNAGWYDGDVPVRWSASDPESGVPTAVADTTISGEGTGLTSTTSATNGAGLTTTATSAPPVNIDRTAPTTGISGASNEWVNGSVQVTLTADDNLSGIAKTEYSVDGGASQTGTTFSLTAEGEHAIAFFSTDKAGNTEPVRTAKVRIDTTAPSIRHDFAPADYLDGAWTNRDVTVTFACSDQGSGVAECTPPVATSTEGDVTVVGTAKDHAGNSATDSVIVRIDKTAPQIEANVRGTKNDAGWYNGPVTVEYTASDALSGLTDAPTSVLLGEGANQDSAGVATDAAGNSARASVSGINVDTTPPALTATFPRGWHTDNVAVDWSCTDALSGVATQPVDDTVRGEGSNLSSTASCVDVAGNAVTKTVTGISIDRSAPTTTASIPGVPSSGWFANAVPVTLTGSDNLSGVSATQYTIDGGSALLYDGPFEVSDDGIHTIAFWSTDGAGNRETAGAPLTVQVDTTAPTTTVVNPISPETGWFTTSGIPVAFRPSDSGSGVAATYYTIDGGPTLTYGEAFTADLSTGTHTITFWSVDLAGNTENTASANTIAVNVDTVAPMISGLATPVANAAGWNRTDVDVKFTCDDVGSGLRTGVAGCAGDTTLTNEGAGQSVTGDAVDVAGNRSSAVLDGINIDKTRPTLVGVPAAPNAAGWHRGDVRVFWVGDDALSGIDPATQPADSTVTGEGVNLGAGPVTIRDKAGNTSEEAFARGINIDRTSPVVTGRPTTEANNLGWYRSEVTVDFTCEDALSGVALCPTSKVLRTDGANQSVTSDPAIDNAGNSSAGTKVGGINIDGTPPSSTSNNTCTAVNDWCKGDIATVLLNAVDQNGLSGVREIRYSIDGGPVQVVEGASASVDVPLTGSGTGTVTYFAVDKAGNAEAANGVALKWDNIAPTVSHSLSPAPNADDWNNSDVTVRFTAKDDDKGSGVATVSPSVVVSSETAGQVITGTAKDTAGNVGTDSVTVKLDKTAPAISGAVTAGTLTASGWYNGPVTVTFTCSDALSGVATCPDPVVLSANGTNTASGTVTDKAGNTRSVTVDGIRIDREKPTLTDADVNVAGGTYTLGSTPAATCTATDSFSGVASCTVTVTGGTTNGVGTWSYTATAVDRAGNTTTITGTYRVIYRFEGFSQPINDTAHQIGSSTSVFKAGSTVPVKFQLKNAAGVAVSSSVAPTWLTPVKGSAMSAPVDESVYTPSADSGSVYRDAGSGQYIYNWKTPAGGHYWRIGVRLDDGQTYYVNIGLR
ncbi:OmpL47-type beta-barrel domain-containing protein [Mycetocola sp.]|uniref:OmpL47-type beta-barrel domain-containing protein n=1 Tax=Mycetocola sp. TaxID=1871042 RepID=UPI003988A408